MDKLDPGVRRTAIALVTGALAVVFDSTIVSVALQALAEDLDASVATIQWVSTAYLLALFVTIPVAGWAQHSFGGKRLWLASLGIFLAGSVLCSLAWDAPSLIAFRVVQGLGGGLMLPLMTTMLMQAAAGRALGRLMAVISLPVMAGPVLGPVLGGVILDRLDWPWLFWVNVPFCVAGIVLAIRLLPADGPRTRPRLDLPGLALVVPGVIAVLYALTNVTEPGGFGRVDVLGPLTGGAALLVAFVAWAVRRGGSALVDVRLLRHRPLASASVLMFLSGAALYGAMLLLPLFYQEVRGADALGAGLMLVPQGIGTLLSRSLAGRFTDRFGPRVVSAAGFALVALSTVPFAFADTASNTWLLAAVLLLRGAGLGAVMIPLMSAAFVGLDRPDMPHASIITRVAQQLGGSFGVAVLAVILHGAAQHAIDPAAAFQESFWWAVGFTAFAVLVSLLLPGRPEAEPEVQPVAAAAA
ncbi:MDR family MFS transporter [Actinoplanes sp. RD1]|uniref:MDR family MFS transporter n=1 Tax=Actinoplanes sp. RD1 TaxID=3064538 RepID=UPI002740E871|nr:MDR family MFS transporter [Actinoplanes sp. RD1]